jgi:hypothetical protein
LLRNGPYVEDRLWRERNTKLKARFAVRFPVNKRSVAYDTERTAG